MLLSSQGIVGSKGLGSEAAREGNFLGEFEMIEDLIAGVVNASIVHVELHTMVLQEHQLP